MIVDVNKANSATTCQLKKRAVTTMQQTPAECYNGAIFFVLDDEGVVMVVLSCDHAIR